MKTRTLSTQSTKLVVDLAVAAFEIPTIFVKVVLLPAGLCKPKFIGHGLLDLDRGPLLLELLARKEAQLALAHEHCEQKTKHCCPADFPLKTNSKHRNRSEHTAGGVWYYRCHVDCLGHKRLHVAAHGMSRLRSTQHSLARWYTHTTPTLL